jgi:hypothetical protein
LFCKQYVDQSNKNLQIGSRHLGPLSKMKLKNSKVVLYKVILKTVKEFAKKPLVPALFHKSCLQGIIHSCTFPYHDEKQKVSSDAFLSLFEIPGWMQLWTPSELGWWCARGLSLYGGACMGTLIDNTFDNKRTALLWLFLSAHGWFRNQASWPNQTRRRKADPEVAAALEGRYSVCCIKAERLEEEYLKDQIAALSHEDWLWLVQQIVRRSKEFGVCKNLGANLFNYFVIRDLRETDVMLSKLLEEITESRLPYQFEFTISMALEDYYFDNHCNDSVPLKVTLLCKYQKKLLRHNMELYTLLS